MRILNGIAHTIRGIVLLFAVMGVSICYHIAMWCATEEQVRQLKERHNG